MEVGFGMHRIMDGLEGKSVGDMSDDWWIDGSIDGYYVETARAVLPTLEL